LNYTKKVLPVPVLFFKKKRTSKKPSFRGDPIHLAKVLSKISIPQNIQTNMQVIQSRLL
jgi:hypothetical protein